ncbi:MAG TPA: toll/interleukin-1 receptor domain-containing protein [Thermoanaerobaculia bacterium]|nr:toll/interleukin-1 receptor domain-containing protein [Thermoanaerobaculia bacterium]
MAEFFVSYAAPDQPWAEWIAWQLEELGHTATLQAWDFVPGSNFVVEMQNAIARSSRTVAVLSPDYLERAFPEAEWAAAFAQDARGLGRRLLPIRVRPCVPAGVLAAIVYVDLVDLAEEAARLSLADAVNGGFGRRLKPAAQPGFPGGVSLVTTRPLDFDGPVVTDERPKRSRSFVHTAVAAGDLLDLSNAAIPYLPSDPTGSERPPSTVFAYVWLPTIDQLRSTDINALIPCAAICTADLVEVADKFRRELGHATEALLANSPAKLRQQDKKIAFESAKKALDTCLTAAVVIPAIVLGIGRARPGLAYEAMCDVLIAPITEVHRKRNIRRFDIRLSPLPEAGSVALRQTKRIAGASFGNTVSYRAGFISEDTLGETLLTLTRLVSWAVGTFYNGGDKTWLRFLKGDIT